MSLLFCFFRAFRTEMSVKTEVAKFTLACVKLSANILRVNSFPLHSLEHCL